MTTINKAAIEAAARALAPGAWMSDVPLGALDISHLNEAFRQRAIEKAEAAILAALPHLGEPALTTIPAPISSSTPVDESVPAETNSQVTLDGCPSEVVEQMARALSVFACSCDSICKYHGEKHEHIPICDRRNARLALGAYEALKDGHNAPSSA